MIETFADILTIFIFAILVFLVWLALSPFETLGWWAGWFGDRVQIAPVPPDGAVRTVRPDVQCYILFFSGVGRASGETLSYRERDFLRRLAAAIPNAVIIDDIFPYAVNNQALISHPLAARFWRFALSSKAGNIPLAGYLINLRNIMQAMISADRRYGPLFNQGVAEVVLSILLRYNYNPDAGAPVYIVGYSGAGQIALGCTLYLKEWLTCPVYVISLGGVFGSDPALLRIDHLYHLVGSKDNIEKLSLFAPGRWSFFATSEWNRAIQQGRVTRIDAGPVGHTGNGGYLDAKHRLPDGRLIIDGTVETFQRIVEANRGRQQDIST